MAGSYWVLGADGREYGPVTLPDLTRWIAERRLVGTSRVRAEGAEWTEAQLVPEIAALFSAGATASPPLAGSARTLALPAEFRVWLFIGQAWDLVKVHWLPLAGMIFIQAAIGCVPYLGPCVQFIIGGAILIGIWRAILGMIDGRAPEVGMMFRGFDQFGDGFLAYIVRAILVGLGFLLLIVPGVILALMWAFTFPVLAETRLGFWEAMHRSAVLTEGYRWRLFLLALACFLVLILGLVAFCVGIFVAVPVCMTAFALAYRWLVERKRVAPATA
jgi:uncharacterized membrane protein